MLNRWQVIRHQKRGDPVSFGGCRVQITTLRREMLARMKGHIRSLLSSWISFRFALKGSGG